MAAKFEIRQPKAGEFRWVLTSQGRTLATSEAYSRRVSAEKAIESFRKGAATATVADLTLAPTKTAAKGATKATKAAKKTVAKAETTTKKRAAASTKKTAAPRKRTSRTG